MTPRTSLGAGAAPVGEQAARGEEVVAPGRTPAASEPRAADQRRDAASAVVCACGHLAVEHGTDSKARALIAAQPCARGGCPCAALTPAARRWTERQTVEEAL